MGTTSSRPLKLRRTTKKSDPLALARHKSAAIPLDSYATVDTLIEEIAVARNITTTTTTSSSNNDYHSQSSSSSLSLQLSSSAELATNSYYPTVRLVVEEDDNDDHSPTATSTTITTTTTATTASSIIVEETTSSSQQNNNNSKTKRTTPTKVRFTTVEQRVYPIVPSDNPSVTGFGPAMALGGWIYEEEPFQWIDEFELSRQPQRRTCHEELRLPAVERRERLLEQGASRDQLTKMATRAQKLKLQRQQTQEAYQFYGRQRYLQRLEQLETSKHFVQKLIGLRQAYHQEEITLWEQAAAQKTKL